MQRLLIGVWLLLCADMCEAQVRWIDVTRSTVTVRLQASGPDTSTAPEVVLMAPLAEGSVEETDPPHLAVVVNLTDLQVVGPGRSADEREGIRALLLGSEGLDAERFSRVTYHSLTVDRPEADIWMIRGELELHGRFLPLDVRARRAGDRFTGDTTIDVSDFGLSPLRRPGSHEAVGPLAHVELDVILESP